MLFPKYANNFYAEVINIDVICIFKLFISYVFDKKNNIGSL